MRKRIGAIPFAILLAGLVSCQKIVAEREQPQDQKSEITLHAGSQLLSKVTLGNGLNPVWSQNDTIAVFDGVSINPFVASTIDGSSAEFGGSVSSGATTLTAVYPCNRARLGSGNKIMLEFPDNQLVAVGDSSCSSALICVAKTSMEDKHLDFKNVYSLLKVDIDIDGVTSLKITGKKGETLAGTCEMDIDSESVTPVEKKSSITVRSASGSFAKGSYYVAVLPVSFTEGFSVQMSRADGMTAVKTTENSLSVARNRGADLSSVTFETKWKIEISTAAQLLEWNSGSSLRTAFDEVELKNDINLDGQEWVPTDFKGVFEGNGYHIYNIVVTPSSTIQTDRLLGGFFARIYGNVQNLVLGSSDGISYDGKSIVKLGATELTGWSLAGGVAGSLNGGQIKNVTTFSTVEVSAEFAKKAKIGGVVGVVNAADSKLTDCSNYGSVVNNASTSTATTDGNRSNIGGIAGCCEDKSGIEISGCKNYGTVTSNNSEVEFIGGVIAVSNGGVAAGGTGGNVITIKDCCNYGKVSISNGSKPSVGGIAGCLCAAALEGCVNEGTVTANVTSELKIGGIAGKYIASVESAVRSCINGKSGDTGKGSIETDSGTASAFIGGIIGYIPTDATGALTVSACENHASIQTLNSYAGYIGGFGGYWNAKGCLINMENCHNYGDISNLSSAEDAGNNRVAGFVGEFANDQETVSSVTNCVNHAKVRTSKARKAAAMIGGLFGSASYMEITDCTNEGDISFSNTLAATNSMNVGGIVGYGNNGVIFTSCKNSGNVQIGSSAVTGLGITGGIVGNIVGGSIDGCTNSGNVSIQDGYNGNGNVGGMAGAIKGTSISGSTNKGAISIIKKKGHFLIGGILGETNAQAGACVKNCINEGTVTATESGYARQYFTVGGIVGRSKGVSGSQFEITGCTNRGVVTVSANTDNQLCNAGGIVGETNTYSKVSDNVNEVTGTVICVNDIADTYATRTAYAGGIIGGDNEGTVGAAGNDTVTGNTNYANVSATVTKGATAIGAGGVFGMLQRTGSFTDNMVLGTPAVVADGGAGAVMGYLAAPAIKEITASVSAGTTVNGVDYDSVKDSPAKISAWLLPGNNGNVSATIVDAQ